MNAKIPQTFSSMKYCFRTINSDLQTLESYFLEKLAQNLPIFLFLTWLGKNGNIHQPNSEIWKGLQTTRVYIQSTFPASFLNYFSSHTHNGLQDNPILLPAASLNLSMSLSLLRLSSLRKHFLPNHQTEFNKTNCSLLLVTLHLISGIPYFPSFLLSHQLALSFSFASARDLF